MEAIKKQEIETHCCVCNRMKTEWGWRNAAGSNSAYRSHTYCPSCYKAAMEQIQSDLQALNLQFAS